VAERCELGRQVASLESDGNPPIQEEFEDWLARRLLRVEEEKAVLGRHVPEGGRFGAAGEEAAGLAIGFELMDCDELHLLVKHDKLVVRRQDRTLGVKPDIGKVGEKSDVGKVHNPRNGRHAAYRRIYTLDRHEKSGLTGSLKENKVPQIVWHFSQSLVEKVMASVALPRFKIVTRRSP
jgi:hypothetical protein